MIRLAPFRWCRSTTHLQLAPPSADASGPGEPRACARGQLPQMSNHHAYQMYAHITWHTWKRVGCVDAAAASDVRSAVASACQATGVRVFRDAVLADHVHVVVSFRPDIRLSDFVRLAKSVAATRANRRVTGTVRWARGYFVTTIHKRDLRRVTGYVADQFQRHPDLVPKESGRERMP